MPFDAQRTRHVALSVEVGIELRGNQQAIVDLLTIRRWE